MTRYALRERDGRVQARWYTDDGKRRSQTFATRTEAKKFLDRVSADRQRGSYIDPRDGRRRLREIAELWMASRPPMRPKTQSTYRSILTCHIYPRFQATPVGTITPLDVQNWISELSRSGLAPGTVHNCFRVLKGVLDAAVKAEYLRANPASVLKANDLPRTPERDKHFLSAEQVGQLAAEFPSPYDLLIRFAAVSGMRAGEVAALRWENVDLLRGRVTVCESISRIGLSWTIQRPKNNRNRTLSLMAEVAAEMRQWASEHPDFAPESYVWPGPFGGSPREPMNYSKHFYNRMFRPAVTRAGLPERLRFHDLRHTCASLLIAQNVAPKAIQEHLGHAKFAITMDLYGHLYDDAKDELAAAMSRAFTPGGTIPTGARTGPQQPFRAAAE